MPKFKEMSAAEYRAIHYWVQKQLGKPSLCEECGTTTAKWFDWANISQNYERDLKDWRRLCRKCHIQETKRFYRDDCRTHCNAGHEQIPENIYEYPSGYKECRLCRVQHSTGERLRRKSERSSSRRSSDEKMALRTLRGENHPRSRLTPEQVKEIRLLSKQGLSNTQIGVLFEVNASAIRQIILGKTWGHLADDFEESA